MYLWYLEKIWRKSAIPDTKKVSGTNLCRHDLAESAKSADFWLSGRHVADMSATFPAKLGTMLMETKLLLHLLSLITKTRPKSKLVL
jgi:hypothetical protein